VNTLTEDFNKFIGSRLSYVDAKIDTPNNEAAHALEQTLNHEQLQFFIQAMDYKDTRNSIIEENAYRQGFIDAIHIMGL
jgi:hypothetical protein